MEGSSAPSYLCSVCRNKFPVGEIKYSSNGKIVCNKCLGSKPKNDSSKTTDIIIKSSKNSDARKYICVSCRYKFSLKKSSKIKLACPYCGKENLMEDKYSSAEDLLKDAGDDE
jgi:DNA-directed RNA polymerase subunit RPC12/RpoP